MRAQPCSVLPISCNQYIFPNAPSNHLEKVEEKHQFGFEKSQIAQILRLILLESLILMTRVQIGIF